MDLRRQKHYGEQQGQNAKARTVKTHVLNKMELREKWLRGQVIRQLGLRKKQGNLTDGVPV